MTKSIRFVQTKFAIGGQRPPTPGASLLRVIARTVRLLGTWWMTGAGSPSPFFDDQTRAPRALSRVLDAAERRAL